MALYDVRVKVELDLEYTLDAENEDDAALQAEHMAFSAYEPSLDSGLYVSTMWVDLADSDEDEAA